MVVPIYRHVPSSMETNSYLVMSAIASTMVMMQLRPAFDSLPWCWPYSRTIHLNRCVAIVDETGLQASVVKQPLVKYTNLCRQVSVDRATMIVYRSPLDDACANEVNHRWLVMESHASVGMDSTFVDTMPMFDKMDPDHFDSDALGFRNDYEYHFGRVRCPLMLLMANRWCSLAGYCQNLTNCTVMVFFWFLPSLGDVTNRLAMDWYIHEYDYCS